MDGIWHKRGTKLEAYDDGIRFNEDCTVEISASIYVGAGLTFGDTVYARLHLNGTNIATLALTRAVAASTTSTAAVCNVVVSSFTYDFSAGDVVHLYALNSAAARGSMNIGLLTRMTVKEI